RASAASRAAVTVATSVTDDVAVRRSYRSIRLRSAMRSRKVFNRVLISRQASRCCCSRFLRSCMRTSGRRSMAMSCWISVSVSRPVAIPLIYMDSSPYAPPAAARRGSRFLVHQYPDQFLDAAHQIENFCRRYLSNDFFRLLVDHLDVDAAGHLVHQELQALVDYLQSLVEAFHELFHGLHADAHHVGPPRQFRRDAFSGRDR